MKKKSMLKMSDQVVPGVLLTFWESRSKVITCMLTEHMNKCYKFILCNKLKVSDLE